MNEIAHTIKSSVLNESFSIELLRFNTFVLQQPYRPDYNSILFITDGEATVLLDNEKISLTKNSLLLIAKNQVYFFTENTTVGYFLQFGNCFWDKTPISASNCKAVLFDSGSAGRLLKPDSSDLPELYLLFATILNDFQGPHYSNKQDALSAYLKILIIKIANIHALLTKEATLYDTKLVQNFRLLVEKDSSTSHNVSDYAQKLGVSARKLQEVCKVQGTGAKEIVNAHLIAEAKRALHFSSQPVKEIAAGLGFPNPYQFSAFFKKHTYNSPVAYRQQLVETDI